MSRPTPRRVRTEPEQTPYGQRISRLAMTSRTIDGRPVWAWAFDRFTVSLEDEKKAWGWGLQVPLHQIMPRSTW